jgi:hypothetical protein
MLELNQKDRTQRIAELVHEGQKDKADAAYINHPRRVAQNTFLYLSLDEARYSVEEREIAFQAAWLHDVVEDSGFYGFPAVSFLSLTEWGIRPEVIEVVKLLTKTEKSASVPADDPYYQAIKANELARAVKIADLTDNSNKERVAKVLELGVKDKSDYYLSALDFLDLSPLEKEVFKVRIDLPTETSDEVWLSKLDPFLVGSVQRPIIKGRMTFSQLYWLSRQKQVEIDEERKEE